MKESKKFSDLLILVNNLPNFKIYFSRYDSSTIKDEKGCPRCGGAVFQNEEIIEKGISYHKKCFTCHQCNRPLTDKLQVFNGFDQEIYCKVCYPKIMHTPLPMDPKDKIKVKALNNDPDACPRCSGKVYANEIVPSKGRNFHKDCFTCYDCKHILNVSTGNQYNKVLCNASIYTS